MIIENVEVDIHAVYEYDYSIKREEIDKLIHDVFNNSELKDSGKIVKIESRGCSDELVVIFTFYNPNDKSYIYDIIERVKRHYHEEFVPMYEEFKKFRKFINIVVN